MNLLLPLLAAAAVVVIYLLRTPPRPIVIPTSYLWQKLAERARPLRERLRWILSLLLAMTIACLMAWALSRSPFFGGGRGQTALAVVIDNSASMAAQRTDGRTRLDEALLLARRAMNANNGPILVADTGGQLGSLVYADAERGEDLLSQISIDFTQNHRYPPMPDPPGSSIAKTIYLTDGVLAPDPPTREQDDATTGPASTQNPIIVQSVFEAVTNVGITAFDTRRAPDGKLYAYIELVHAADQSNEVHLVVRESSTIRLDRRLTLGANELWSGVIDVTGWASPLSAEVTLSEAQDAFEADNVAWRLMAAEVPPRILLLSDRPEGLLTLLRSTSPGVVVQTLSTTQLYSQQRAPGFWSNFDLLVADRTAPQDQPPIASWWIAPPAADYLPGRIGVASVSAPPVVADAVPEGSIFGSPAIAVSGLGADSLAELEIRQVQKVDLSVPFGSSDVRDVRVLAETENLPLLISWQDGTPQLLQTFDMPDRDFVRSPTVPVLAANLIAGLKRSESNISPGTFWSGQPIKNVVALEEALSTGRRAGPEILAPTRHTSLNNGETAESPSAAFFANPGLYRIQYQTANSNSDPENATAAAQYQDVSVNLTSRAISQINQPRIGQQASRQPPGEDSEVATSRSVPWRFLILIALALGILEWFTFNRKVTI